MRRRIYIQLMAVSGVAIYATLLLVTAVYYEVFERQVFEDLKTCTGFLAGLWTQEADGRGNGEGTGGSSGLKDAGNFILPEQAIRGQGLRITLIVRGGEVVFDSAAQGEDLGNHGDRAEVMDAFARGEGKIVRNSPTLGGKAILLISLELDEIMDLADTIGVIYNGKIQKIADRAALTANEVGEFMMGVKSDEGN